MKAVFIGSVSSSREALQAMLDVHFPVAYVFSLDESASANVSGYYPIHSLAQEHGVAYRKFKKINEQGNVDIIKGLAPDYIFVVGLSQLVKKEIIDAAKEGVVGFHPTPLPKMRGRAAVVWQMLLGVHETKCTAFFIDEGTDAGDILGQEAYTIEEADYAADVCGKIDRAAYRLFRRVLKGLMDGTVEPRRQEEGDATYLLKRGPEDGMVDWDQPACDIHRLVRAVSRPYPGAFGMYDGRHKIIIWRAEVRNNKKYIGLNGQIAAITDEYIDVVCKDGLLRITEFENVDSARLLAGHKMR